MVKIKKTQKEQTTMLLFCTDIVNASVMPFPYTALIFDCQIYLRQEPTFKKNFYILTRSDIEHNIFFGKSGTCKIKPNTVLLHLHVSHWECMCDNIMMRSRCNFEKYIPVLATS